MKIEKIKAYFWNADEPYNSLKFTAEDFKWEHFERKVLELRKPLFGPVYWEIVHFGTPQKKMDTMTEIVWVSIRPLTKTPEFLKKPMLDSYPL